MMMGEAGGACSALQLTSRMASAATVAPPGILLGVVPAVDVCLLRGCGWCVGLGALCVNGVSWPNKVIGEHQTHGSNCSMATN